MGLKTAIQRGVQAGVSALGTAENDGLRESVTYREYRSAIAGYDPAQKIGSKITEPYTDHAGLQATCFNYREQEIDGRTIQVNDERLLFTGIDFQNRGIIEPKNSDLILRTSASGAVQKWDIVSISSDPAGASWTFQVRLP